VKRINAGGDCGRMTGNPEVILKSFHEKAGRCQGTLSLSSFRGSVPIQLSRLCRHPSIRTLL
jgi:hypothetical protein